jgi:hypothetical protein
VLVSAPQTVHLPLFFKRSTEIERLACSRISGGTTGSCLGCGFRLIDSPVLISLWQKPRPGNNPDRKTTPASGRFRDLDYYADIQRSAAPRTALPHHDTRILPPEVKLGWYRVRADRAVDLPLQLALNECFHHPASLHPTPIHLHGLYQFRNNS